MNRGGVVSSALSAAPSLEASADRRLDARLLPAAVAAWAWAALALVVPVVVLAAVALGAVGLATAWALRRRAGTASLALVLIAAVAVSVGAGRLERSAGLLQPLAAEQATAVLDGVAVSDATRVRVDPARSWGRPSPRWTVRLSVRTVTGRGSTSAAHAEVLVIGGAGWEAVRRGDRVHAVGRLQPTDLADPSAAVLRAMRSPTTAPASGWAARAGQRLREGLVRVCAPLPTDARGLLPGLVVGDTTAVPTSLDADLRTTGLTHLTSVSGGNTALVAGAVVLLGGVVGLSRRARLVLAVGALLAYAALAGGEPSVLRAAAMGTAALLGTLLARGGGGLPTLCLAVAVLLVADPWLARQAGFTLSVLATGALLVLAPSLAASLARPLLRGRVPGRRAAPVRDALVSGMAVAVAVPVSAQLVCAPVVLLLAPGLPALAVPANVLAGPAVAPATLLGLLAALLEPWGPVGAALAGLAARLGGLAAQWIALVARTGAEVPGAVVPWAQGPGAAVALAVLTVVALSAPRGVRAVSAALQHRPDRRLERRLSRSPDRRPAG
ncbi:ComEC/Rec2-related protein [Quadrisphaera granulorum]|uniref:ComEC/Rec2-related protein n=1 Tax=Quadrisphaera granulorum TaxID=317664 RepID=A0A316AV83_9ACTN|nr:ComEC/Rec2 family competence protein [Quadrisphaera granulorum]PWJ54007.1 ComEC/Rec2-related protein [Quadrisphaera granulorum]SZE96464.1 ComEC/Rec2-related protein [Quadrisphaera granulorum]